MLLLQYIFQNLIYLRKPEKEIIHGKLNDDDFFPRDSDGPHVV